jgi:hypothetical protein
MKVTDLLTITELSRITNKSRPTLYKYISDFELGALDEIPPVMVKLFQSIVSGEFSKKDVYSYCDIYFMDDSELKDVILLIKENSKKLNLERLKEFILKEIR